MAFDEYHLSLDTASNMQASGPDGLIGGLQAVSRTAYTSVIAPRQFKSIGQAIAVQIDNPTEAGIFLPDSTLYVPPHTSGYQSNLSRPALQAFVQARIDSVVVQFPAGGELCVLRYLDAPVSFSPGTSSAGTVAAELVVPGNVNPSSSDSLGVFARRIGLTVATGYDLAGSDNANYVPARTPNLWLTGNDVLIPPATGLIVSRAAGSGAEQWRLFYVDVALFNWGTDERLQVVDGGVAGAHLYTWGGAAAAGQYYYPMPTPRVFPGSGMMTAAPGNSFGLQLGGGVPVPVNCFARYTVGLYVYVGPFG